MRLVRYTGWPPKFLVYRRLEPGQKMPAGVRFIPGPEGSAYYEVNPEDCFVMKRQDVNSVAALMAYAQNAFAMCDFELSQDMTRLAVEWTASPGQKTPD
jgi:hypothetical protein